jgi:hypothetical protein
MVECTILAPVWNGRMPNTFSIFDTLKIGQYHERTASFWSMRIEKEYKTTTKKPIIPCSDLLTHECPKHPAKTRIQLWKPISRRPRIPKQYLSRLLNYSTTHSHLLKIKMWTQVGNIIIGLWMRWQPNILLRGCKERNGPQGLISTLDH